MLRSLLIISSALAFAGCAAGEEAQVRSTIKDYSRAYSDADGDRFCSLLAPEARDAFEDEEGGCAGFFHAHAIRAPASAVKAGRSVRITSVRITGDVAVVETKGNKRPYTLRKLDGRWLVEGYEKP